jgi:hypothetical protein
MRLIRRLVILVVGLWLVLELAAIPVLGQIVQHEVSARSHGATTIRASIGTFPVLARAFFAQRVNSVSVTLDRVAGERVPFTTIRFDAHGVGIDRASLLKGKVKVTSIDTGTVTASLELPADVGAHVQVSGHTLVMGPVAVALRSDLFPCTPDATVNQDQVTLSCTFTGVPPILQNLD